MKNYEIYPKTYFMSHNLTPFCRVVARGAQRKLFSIYLEVSISEKKVLPRA